MDFTAFDTTRIDEYCRQAKEQWGTTEAYRQFEEKSSGRSRKEEAALSIEIMELFAEFGALMRKGEQSDSELVQDRVRNLQDFITANYYDCTEEILRSLGKMYGGGGAFTENIDQAAGEGCARFVEKAIEAYSG